MPIDTALSDTCCSCRQGRKQCWQLLASKHNSTKSLNYIM